MNTEPRARMTGFSALNTSNGVAASDLKEALSVLPLDKFLTLDLPARRNLLSPWLSEQGLAMIYAPRGVGKTFLGLSIGLTIAGGGQLLGWRSQASASVVYLDGEMPAVDVQARLTALIQGRDEAGAVAGFFVINPDLNIGRGVPDLSTPKGQQLLDSAIPRDTGLIIVDNLSSLTSGDENDGSLWHPVQKWMLQHRSAGRSVLLIHHAGKKGSQRGTSRREDVLDTVIALRRPKGYAPSQGARFEVHFEKCRGVYGSDVRPFEAKLNSCPDGGLSWSRCDLTNRKQIVAELLNQGMSQTDVAIKLGVNKSTVCRYAKEIKQVCTHGGDS